MPVLASLPSTASFLSSLVSLARYRTTYSEPYTTLGLLLVSRNLVRGRVARSERQLTWLLSHLSRSANQLL